MTRTDAPTPDGSVSAQITRAVVGVFRDYTGRGPTKARTFLTRTALDFALTAADADARSGTTARRSSGSRPPRTSASCCRPSTPRSGGIGSGCSLDKHRAHPRIR